MTKKDLPFDQQTSGAISLRVPKKYLPPPPPEEMTDEQIGKFVADKLANLAAFSEALKPYYLDLRRRFHEKRRFTTVARLSCLSLKTTSRWRNPEEVHARLMRNGDQIQSGLLDVLRSCHEWIGAILRAEKTRAAEQR